MLQAVQGHRDPAKTARGPHLHAPRREPAIKDQSDKNPAQPGRNFSGQGLGNRNEAGDLLSRKAKPGPALTAGVDQRDHVRTSSLPDIYVQSTLDLFKPDVGKGKDLFCPGPDKPGELMGHGDSSPSEGMSSHRARQGQWKLPSRLDNLFEASESPGKIPAPIVQEPEASGQ